MIGSVTCILYNVKTFPIIGPTELSSIEKQEDLEAMWEAIKICLEMIILVLEK